MLFKTKSAFMVRRTPKRKRRVGSKYYRKVNWWLTLVEVVLLLAGVVASGGLLRVAGARGLVGEVLEGVHVGCGMYLW